MLVLKDKYDIDFASPKGPNPEVDESSVKGFPADKGFLEDPVVIEKLAKAKKLSEVNVADYDAIFYAGGQGPVLDLATDPVNAKLASDVSHRLDQKGREDAHHKLQFYRAGKPTAAVCHGPAALQLATDANGDNLFKGKHATSLTNEEEVAIDGVKVCDGIGVCLVSWPDRGVCTRTFRSSLRTA